MKKNHKNTLLSILLSASLIGFTAAPLNQIHNDPMVHAAINQTKPANKPGASSASSAKLSGTQTVTSQKTVNDADVKADQANRSALLVKKGGILNINNSVIAKTGNTTSEDNSNFFGQNAGLLVTSNATANVNHLTETTNGNGANAVFATGNKAVINLNHAKINTKQNSSRGLDATQKGTIKATNTNISTQGSHSATLATDRGGGTVSLNTGNLKTAGDGSPIIYSTGKINVKNVQGNASSAEAAVIEGDNSINATDSHLTANQNNGVMLYQSMSGDSKTGTASFTMKGGSLTSKVTAGSKGTTKHTGALFYVTNTNAKINLNNVKLSNASNTLIRAASDRWGSSNSNGGKLAFTATKQALTGNVEVASGSSVALVLKDGSSLSGSINSSDTKGVTKLTLNGNSSWNVTQNSYLTELVGSKASLKNIKSNGHKVYYDQSNQANSWLNGKTYKLAGGGTLSPK
ncbi:hypothetical protein MOO44_06765 [Nicoliella spurrieriana]|uniref:Adhesin n=1 Tax=Nicoliella spurrieriana TaxID=2925830 RepID=A0A976RRP0_9LACO|nr:hypothetical protein [Nicoliella spurrieriana]UQS86587.1 hypothetical protein MOO44_06765 [Nicoliella spurrieriana]